MSMKRTVVLLALLAIAFMYPTSAAAAAMCEDLRVTGGNNRFVPATVSFAARASEPVPFYTFSFGDGEQTVSASPQTSHVYTISGTYTARVDVNNSSCRVIFSLLSSPLESQKSGCANVFIEGGNNFPAGTDVKFFVTGYENKSGIKSYKIDFGNGTIKQQDTGNFHLTYPAPGTYTVKGYITDSKNAENGGDGSCQVPLYITGQPLQTQPATGTPTWVTAVGLAAGIWLFLALRKQFSHR